jgi:hypothetical protein
MIGTTTRVRKYRSPNGSPSLRPIRRCGWTDTPKRVCETEATFEPKQGLAVWTAYSRHDESGNKAWFLCREGYVTVKNPDEEILRKMWSIAQDLSAKVQGDDGEIYDSSGNGNYRQEP